jgi:endoglucanase
MVERTIRPMVLAVLLGLSATASMAQELSRYIVVDQFGYLPGSRKVAVLRDPVVGFDADESFAPGSWYAVVNATTGDTVYRAERTQWAN